MDLVQVIARLAVDRKTTKWLCPLLLSADALLCMLILWRIPCTYLLILVISLIFFLVHQW